MKVKELQNLLLDLDPELEINSFGHKYNGYIVKGYAKLDHLGTFQAFRPEGTLDEKEVASHLRDGWVASYYY